MVYFRRMPIFLSGGFFCRVGGGFIQKQPQNGGLKQAKMRENYDICTGNVHKKSHRAKKLAFGRNETPSTPVNQKQPDLDYTEFFQVHPKFPLTTSETLSCAKAVLLRIRVLFNNIDCTRSHKFYTVRSSALRRDVLSMCDVIHCKRHIVTDIKVTIKI